MMGIGGEIGVVLCYWKGIVWLDEGVEGVEPYLEEDFFAIALRLRYLHKKQGCRGFRLSRLLRRRLDLC